jgi:hypothetical protein
MGAAAIARQLGATRQGNNWRVRCPCGCGYALSLSDGEDGRLLAFCFGGCAFSEIELALVARGGLFDGDVSHVSRPVIVRQRDDPARIAHARQIYDSGVWDERVAVYLRSRGIQLTRRSCGLPSKRRIGSAPVCRQCWRPLLTSTVSRLAST